MEQRYFTKTLWAAAIVIMAIGALGQDVLADKPLPTRVLTTVTVSCGPKGFVEADGTVVATIVNGDVTIETQQDRLIGTSCISVLRGIAGFGMVNLGENLVVRVVPTENGLVINLSLGWWGIVNDGKD